MNMGQYMAATYYITCSEFALRMNMCFGKDLALSALKGDGTHNGNEST